MRYLLNSAVIAASAFGDYRYEPASVAELRAFLLGDFASRIGYQQTADYIERATGIKVVLSRETSVMQPGDTAMVVRLRYRVDPTRKGSIQAVDDTEWEIGRLSCLSKQPRAKLTKLEERSIESVHDELRRNR